MDTRSYHEELEKKVEQREAKIHDEGLTALRDAHKEHLYRINGWHDATQILRETSPSHPLFDAARQNYSDAVHEVANADVMVFFEESKLSQPRATQ